MLARLALPRSQLAAWGAAVLVAYALHAGFHTSRDEAWNLMWACNVATVALAAGCMARQRWLVAVALCWLGLGTPLWLLDLINGGEWTITSTVIHVGAPLVAIGAARTLTVPRGTWLVAITGLAALMAASRLVTPRALNVNLAYGVYAGWEALFPDPRVYYAALVAVSALAFWAIERIMRRDRWDQRRPRPSVTSAGAGASAKRASRLR
jgi:hypothetical protein